ncbi:MAG: AMP-binding protein [Vicinamibacterales bacterium]
MVLCHGGTLYIDRGCRCPLILATDLCHQPARGLAHTVVQRAARLRPAGAASGGGRAAAAELLRGARRHLLRRGCASTEPVGPSRAAGGGRRRRSARDAVRLGLHGNRSTATIVHYPIPRAGNTGNPVPGCELKLVPSGGKMEVRVRGANVTPGYFRQPELTAAAFDEDGFYRIGDAVVLADGETRHAACSSTGGWPRISN